VGAVEDGGVMEPAWPVTVGRRLVIDGETVFVNGVDGAEVRGFTAVGAPVRFVLTRVAGEEDAAASAEECSVSKLFKKRHELEQRGVAALVDRRATRSTVGPEVDDRLRAAIAGEAQELAEASDVRKMQFRARVASRLARESGEPLELPCSRQKFNRIVDDGARIDGPVPVAGEEPSQRAERAE